MFSTHPLSHSSHHRRQWGYSSMMCPRQVYAGCSPSCFHVRGYNFGGDFLWQLSENWDETDLPIAPCTLQLEHVHGGCLFAVFRHLPQSLWHIKKDRKWPHSNPGHGHHGMLSYGFVEFHMSNLLQWLLLLYFGSTTVLWNLSLPLWLPLHLSLQRHSSDQVHQPVCPVLWLDSF